jgi:CheY-like chemotaxis protein/two-component sensor histidine kinase
MSKIEANKMTVSLDEMDFEKMLIRVTNVVSYSIEEKQQVFNVDIENDIPQYLISDGQRLSQVITNLLSNAVKFTPPGGAVTLKVEKTGESGGTCTFRIEVRDTGIGISHEQQARLFQSFEQADSSISRQYGGTGLGLAISKVIVEMLGGSIWVESELGAGSRFIFTFKAEKGRANDYKIRPAIPLSETLRLLVVDDSQSVLDYFINLSSKYHFLCDTALDGYSATDMIRKNNDGYHIVFVDLNMPGMDGLQLTRHIKTQNATNTVVIMISAMDWSEIETEARQAGVDHFISKPLFPSTVIDAINKCLGFAVRPDEPEADSLDFSNRRILLAEDIDINQEILITLLKPTGIQIDCANNGEHAVRLFSENPDQYDLILMDIHMPGKDGYEATREIRGMNLARARDIPIIAMTANVFREDIDKCFEAGMNDHIGKPVDIDEVQKTLQKHFLTPAQVG